MQKKNKYLLLGILSIVLVSAIVYAFEVVELARYDLAVHPNGATNDAVYLIHERRVINGTESLKWIMRTTFRNQTTNFTMTMREDGSFDISSPMNITINGKGICLADGTSSTGGKCPRYIRLVEEISK